MINSNTEILKTEALSVGYQSKKNQVTVANNINLSMKKGELVGLVGANGIGKSTLLRTLANIQEALGGTIEINSKSLESYLAPDLAKVLSLVLTEQLMSKNLSVYEMVALGRQPYTNWMGKLHENDMAIVDEAIKQTNSSNLKHKKCYELSDGQLQIIMIARALAQDTQLIILDEPTTHLDMYHKAYILNLLKKITKEIKKTILFSSHEIDLAIQLCDKMIVMTNEKVISETPTQLINTGVFENLFPKDLIAFDKELGRFRVRK
ncbi:MAG: ABC transporter ATP-binding protein [Bacteroidota bacterium]